MDQVELTEHDVRRARHGYYASLSYVDEKIGEVLDALEACGLADDTVVLLTSDHGDLLGEHGLFFKMSFREHACRVPLLVRAPGCEPRLVHEPVSLVDVLPTLADLARAGFSTELAAPVDGRSLVPLLGGAAEDPDATVVGEYLGECVPAPMVMIRRGRWKFVHMPGDPDQLFDLEADPHELRNLAGEAGYSSEIRAFAEEAAARWDLEAIEERVRESQRARLAVFEALTRGRQQPWDFEPVRSAAEQYTRNTMDVAERDLHSRFPPVGPT
jgi:choline-sulfatase